MNTPITDAFALKIKTPCGEKYWVPVDIARKLERERDEAREALAAEIKHHTETTAKWNGHHMDLTIAQCDLNKAIRQRDEEREQRDRLAEALQNVINEDGTPISIDQADVALQSLTPNQP